MHRTLLRELGFARGSSALRASVLSDLPGLCCGKTGDSTQLLSLQLFPILEFGAGVERSFHPPHWVGEGPPCLATLLARKHVPGVGGNALSLGRCPQTLRYRSPVTGEGNKLGCDHRPPGRDAGSLPCLCLSPGSICLCPRAGKAAIVPLQRALTRRLRSLWGGTRSPFLPEQPPLLAAIAEGWRRSQCWCGSTGKKQWVKWRRELGWCNSLTGCLEKYIPGELELNPVWQGS